MKVRFEKEQEDVIDFEDINVYIHIIVGMWNNRVFTVTAKGEAIDVITGETLWQFSREFAEQCTDLAVFEDQSSEPKKFIHKLLGELI